MFSMFSVRETARAQDILSSIATHGLCAPRPTSLRGSLKLSTDPTQLCYNQVELTDPARLDETVKSLVFDEKEGFLSIASERKFDGAADILSYQLSDAMLNSVVFVFSCDIKKKGEHADTAVLRWPNLRLCEAPVGGEDDCYFEEVRLPGNEHPVPTSAIKAILAPMHLLTLVKQAFSSTMIIPVISFERTLTEDPIEVFITGKSARGKNVLGPNYVQALHAALAEFPEMNTFGVHLTRLPLVFMTNTAESLATNKVDYQKLVDRKVLRLVNLSPAQLSDVASVSGVQVVREDRRKNNTYLCFCRSEQKAELADMIVPREETASVEPELKSDRSPGF